MKPDILPYQVLVFHGRMEKPAGYETFCGAMAHVRLWHDAHHVELWMPFGRWLMSRDRDDGQPFRIAGQRELFA